MDGPSGSGKSTLARRVANALGYLFLDTGAMYRALSLGISRRGASALFLDAADRLARGSSAALEGNDAEVRALESALDRVEVGLDESGRVLLDGAPVGDEIRGPAMDRLVSPISTLAPVRRRLVDLQRAAREQITRSRSHGGLVAEGRDMGTVVFPDATLKLYLDAAPAERARRRQAEERLRGIDRALELVEAEIVARDARDAARSASPLVCAADAVRIDTTGQSLDSLEQHIKSLMSARLVHLNEGAT